MQDPGKGVPGSDRGWSWWGAASDSATASVTPVAGGCLSEGRHQQGLQPRSDSLDLLAPHPLNWPKSAAWAVQAAVLGEPVNVAANLATIGVEMGHLIRLPSASMAAARRVNKRRRNDLEGPLWHSCFRGA